MSGRAGQRVVEERERFLKVKQQTGKPILLWSYTLPAPEALSTLAEAGYAVATNMRNCAGAMRAMADYNAVRERFLSAPAIRSTDSAVRERVAAALRVAGPALTEAQSKPLLAAYGIGASGSDRLAASADEAVAAFTAIGRPVVLKVQSPDILHKTEAGAVALSLADADAVRLAYERILASARRHAPAARIDGVLVQPMAPAGREIILGISRDPTFGPLLMLGLGGIHVEVLKDVAFAPVPLAPEAADALIASLNGARLLDTHRGQPAADRDALVDLMVKLSHFAADHAGIIAEMDLNPVILHAEGSGATIADALIVTRR